ncbi:MAG: curli assembly protein CsgF [Halanaerobium sp.]
MQIKIFSIFLILILVLSISSFALAASTTSYSFRVLNNGDQRQVAYNLASKQHEMSLEVDKIAQFKSLIEGRIMSMISSDIVEKMLAEEGFGGDSQYDTDSLEIFVEERNGTVIVTIINKESGEEDELVYNPGDWPDLSGF